MLWLKATWTHGVAAIVWAQCSDHCFFGFWATKAAHSWHQRKASICGCCTFQTIFFMVKYCPGYFIRLSGEGFSCFSDPHLRPVVCILHTCISQDCPMHNSDLQMGTMKRPSRMHIMSAGQCPSLSPLDCILHPSFCHCLFRLTSPAGHAVK